MGLIEIFILAVSLSMDAFAVSICKGLAMGKVKAKNAVTVGLYFGVFQALMPTIGYLLGIGFRDAIEDYDHWIAFGLLAFLGAKMLVDALKKDDGNENDADASLNVKEMLLLAVATSIDALAAGISLAFLKVNITTSAIFIGIITFTLSTAGVYVGGKFGEKYKKAAGIIGGAALIILGAKILVEHLFLG